MSSPIAAIPPDPVPDGYQIIYWTFDSRRRGLIHVRLTYIEHKTHREVCGEDRRGVDWIKDWRCESRYVPGMGHAGTGYQYIPATPWNTNGRNSTDGLRRMMADPDGIRFASFDEAKQALAGEIGWIERCIAAREEENKSDRAVIDRILALEEPPL